MGNGITMKTRMEDIEGLIDYSEVYEVDQGNGVIHYTYMLNHPDTSDGKFFNIILKTYGSLEKVIMVTYSLDNQFISDYNATGDLTKFTGTISFEVVNFDAGFPCDEEPNPVPVSGGSGPGRSGGGGSPQPPGNSGNGGGPLNGGNPYNQALVDAKFQAMAISSSVYVAQEDPTSGGSDDDEDPEDNGEEWILVSRSPRYFSTGFDLVDPSNPCGDGEETGIIEPHHQKNCEELKKFTENSEILATLNTLKIRLQMTPKTVIVIAITIARLL
ncbi:MAG: hypothetical protein DI539_00325 [Flavobacterium psychrophilum]|nr:MAG: hypothetical protein DI539_00325 [Flavobacterium psychrophilum]